jgi:hypothetical protein
VKLWQNNIFLKHFSPNGENFPQEKVTGTIWLLLVALSVAETIWSVSSICLLMVVKFSGTLSIAILFLLAKLKVEWLLLMLCVHNK